MSQFNYILTKERGGKERKVRKREREGQARGKRDVERERREIEKEKKERDAGEGEDEREKERLAKYCEYTMKNTYQREGKRAGLSGLFLAEYGKL